MARPLRIQSAGAGELSDGFELMLSKIDSQEAVFFGFLTAALLLFLKHTSDIRKELETKRREAYSKLLTSLNGYLTVQSDENYSLLNQSRAETFLLASDPVA